MIIKRTIDNKEVSIKLTERELSDAYYEQEHLFDIEDVINALDEREDNEFEDYCLTKSQVKKDVDEIAYQKRRNINKYNMDWETATSDAINDYLVENDACADDSEENV